ncbi:MAG TPA: hypothetical protein VL225_17775 [Vicinamibacterales bacterium]|jgi:hypothetical protein|nr:hypothetical protein [Vicinamibacterales bacterium]
MRRAALVILLLVLVALRLPSLVQPAGGDQGLYGYAGQRIVAGEVMYRDMWDQKPPGIGALYALLWRVWPHESMVPGADLAAAAATACLLVVLGRRRYSEAVGFGAAAVFLLFGDPYLQRMSGVYVRGQCEPFIALAVTGSLTLLASPVRRRRQLVSAGLALAAAFWLKYSAAYVLPVAAAAWVWREDPDNRGGGILRELGWIGLGFGIVAAVVLTYFAIHGALTDLRLATIDYNLRYSNETYQSRTGALLYLFSFPMARARVDMLWFLGAIGTLLLAARARSSAAALVALTWLAAAVISIGINGRRDLPNYFVQAAPALALAASAGLATLATSRAWLRWAVAALLAAGFWRVGSDSPVRGMRLGSLPGLVDNLRYDLQYVRGRIDREAYLSRFTGQKFDALEIDRLVRYVRAATDPGDPVFVFGFSGGSVCWKSERRSSSRFFWSRPVLIEFAADRPDYGSAGLLSDLKRRPPAVVALQKEEWHSRDFFMNNAPLRSWLDAGYVMDHETAMFSVWRRQSSRR